MLLVSRVITPELRFIVKMSGRTESGSEVDCDQNAIDAPSGDHAASLAPWSDGRSITVSPPVPSLLTRCSMAGEFGPWLYIIRRTHVSEYTICVAESERTETVLVSGLSAVQNRGTPANATW
jgi:hypothetical protein